MLRYFFPFTAMLAVACVASSNDSTLQIVASDYDQSCTTAADCVAIETGPLCGDCPPCPGAAINKADEAREEQDQSTRLAECPAHPQAECGYCGSPAVACVAGRCQMTLCASAQSCPGDGGADAD